MNKKTFINLWQPTDDETILDGSDKDFIIDLDNVITTAVEETKGFVENLEYHSQGMGCGLEDRDITDRYEAMAYGWEKAIEGVMECFPESKQWVTIFQIKDFGKTIFIERITIGGFTINILTLATMNKNKQLTVVKPQEEHIKHWTSIKLLVRDVSKTPKP